MTKKSRPRVVPGKTHRVKTACGELYVICNDVDGELFEVFAKLGKSGGCGAATMEAVGRAVSVGLRSGVNPHDFIKTFDGIKCHRSDKEIPSCITAIAKAIDEHISGSGCIEPQQ